MLKPKFFLFIILTTLLGSEAFAQFDKSWWLRYSNDHVGANIINAWKVMNNKYYTRVAIVDSGLDYRHPALRNKIEVNKKEIPNNNIDDDGNGCVDDYYGCRVIDMTGDITDRVVHGTHVAGIVTKAAIRTDRFGHKSKIKIIPVSVDPPSGANVARGIDYALSRGAQVINLSLGFNTPEPAIEAALKRAARKNVIVVIAAGNSGNARQHYPASYNLPNTISVASSDKDSVKSYFSTYGKNNIHIFAPGSNIYSTIPKQGYEYMDGTSMAAPVITGIVAMVLTTHGPRAAKQMKKRLMMTSRRFETLEGFVASNGLVNAYNAILGQGSFNFVWSK